MEQLTINCNSKKATSGNLGITAGVVNSGNLEILINKNSDEQATFNIVTTVTGFATIWEAVIQDFANKYAVGGLNFTMHDSGATPSVVSLRLRQAYEKYTHTDITQYTDSVYLELSARERINAFADKDSFVEYMKPSEHSTSPHLGQLDLPTAFDDGIIVGKAKFNGKDIFIAAQNYAFMGGAVGEINGAKLAGLYLKALKNRPRAIVLLLDSGGVRLQEANAGEIAISELIAIIMQLRISGIPVYGVVAGRNGAFGGIGIISQCLDKIIVTENARTGISGAEVIETVMGTDEYDSSDRALVWRTVGGRERATLGDGVYCGKSVVELKSKLNELLDTSAQFSLEELEAENIMLHKRLSQFSECNDGVDIWAKMGISDPESIPNLSDSQFLNLKEVNQK